MLAVIDFLTYLVHRERSMGRTILTWVEVLCIIVGPFIFLSGVDGNQPNDCCSDSAVFAPPHRLTIYILILLGAAAYFYSTWRTKLAPPLWELIVNCFLLTGFVLNVFIGVQIQEGFVWLLGNVSIGALFLTILIKNHQLLFDETFSWTGESKNLFEKMCRTILKSNFFIKYPLLLLFCLPLLLLLSALLFVFGQRPDSAIRAFTETYKHGLSQWDYRCDNVHCGGHYLCSVAANGHSEIVKPQRYGKRNGGNIICNRQLLISNAFEELIEQRWPGFHRVIRKKYDHVGDVVHKYYSVFNNKFFSDIIYILMKPLEWFFLIVLYLVDRKPENRIAQQYLERSERIAISKNLDLLK
jgi:hypothetical protein